MALNSGIQTNQFLTNDDKVCIPSLPSIFLAVLPYHSLKLVWLGVETCVNVGIKTYLIRDVY